MKRKLNLYRVLVSIFLVIAFLLTACSNNRSLSEKAILEGVDSYFKAEGNISRNEELNYANWFSPGNSLTDWIVIAESRQGGSFDREKYLEDLTNYVTEAYKSEVKLDRVKSTEWHRIIMAIEAAGGNPESFASDKDGNPIDLISEGVYGWNHTGSIDDQGSNALIYALICIEACDCTIPEDAVYKIDNLVEMLISYQMDNGAFSLSGNTTDVDITAMAIQALAPLRGSGNASIEDAVDKGIQYLSDQQKQGGYYSFADHYSSDTCSQVILALCAAGIDPKTDERFIKSGRSVYEALLSFRNDDGGFASALDKKGKPEDSDLLASRQASAAIVAYLLLQQGDGNYYDFNNVLH